MNACSNFALHMNKKETLECRLFPKEHTNPSYVSSPMRRHTPVVRDSARRFLVHFTTSPKGNILQDSSVRSQMEY